MTSSLISQDEIARYIKKHGVTLCPSAQKASPKDMEAFRIYAKLAVSVRHRQVPGANGKINPQTDAALKLAIEIIPLITTFINQRMSLDDIAAKLNEMGKTTLSGGPWQGPLIGRLYRRYVRLAAQHGKILPSKKELSPLERKKRNQENFKRFAVEKYLMMREIYDQVHNFEIVADILNRTGVRTRGRGQWNRASAKRIYDQGQRFITKANTELSQG